MIVWNATEQNNNLIDLSFTIMWYNIIICDILKCIWQTNSFIACYCCWYVFFSLCNFCCACYEMWIFWYVQMTTFVTVWLYDTCKLCFYYLLEIVSNHYCLSCVVLNAFVTKCEGLTYYNTVTFVYFCLMKKALYSLFDFYCISLSKTKCRSNL